MTNKTKNLLVNYKAILNLFNIDINKDEDVSDKLLNGLLSCKDFSDCVNAGSNILYFYKHLDKFNAKYEKYADVFDEITGVDDSDISFNVVPLEENSDVLILSNIFTDDVNDFFLCSPLFESNISFIVRKGSKYFIDLFEGESEIIVRPSKWDESDLVFERDGEKILVTSLLKNGQVMCNDEKNKTDYTTVAYDDGMGIFKKSYIDSLNEGDQIDFLQCLAFVEIAIFDKKFFGLTRCEIYEDDLDLNIVVGLTLAPIISQKNFAHQKQTMVYAATASRTAIYHRFH